MKFCATLVVVPKPTATPVPTTFAEPPSGQSQLKVPMTAGAAFLSAPALLGREAAKRASAAPCLVAAIFAPGPQATRDSEAASSVSTERFMEGPFENGSSWGGLPVGLPAIHFRAA